MGFPNTLVVSYADFVTVVFLWFAPVGLIVIVAVGSTNRFLRRLMRTGLALYTVVVDISP